ncbi:LPS export ABC transporter periplasmic protein LptC [Phenylobacterium sp.]|uniref:LPS export ABC transporter periplasmic protein LptC n=1 Tax=Phenylobacterium sp. TaxID=1871053 RepID=UPI0025F1D3B1|nr:LPS export ABC transporter periplasmic protein LptC [Phenylobacterium sp.]MBX3482637.1 LPS export ABC transporter periplasmic protein LptC [Phenylobacterium sp.]
MTAATDSSLPEPPFPEQRRADFERWRRRSRLIRTLRIALPALIALIFAGLVGSVAWSTFNAQPKTARGGDEPIRLVNPRFVGRDDKGRAFVLTADSAIRDRLDYSRVILKKPALVLDENGPEQMRINGADGVFHEQSGKLELSNGVRMEDAKNAFNTASSLFDTKTGEVIGSGPIQGAGGLGEIRAESYGVYGKGETMVFKGGVKTRLEGKK